MDSSVLSWTAATVLDISNFDEGLDSIRFGTSSSGLTGAQLSQITLNGGSAYVDAGGYLTAVPEASGFAFFGGLLDTSPCVAVNSIVFLSLGGRCVLHAGRLFIGAISYCSSQICHTA